MQKSNWGSLFDASRTNRDWVVAGLGTIEEMVSIGFIDFTAEDIRTRMYSKGLKDPAHPNVWGILVRTAASRKIIRRSGFIRAGRAYANGRIIARWSGFNVPDVVLG